MSWGSDLDFDALDDCFRGANFKKEYEMSIQDSRWNELVDAVATSQFPSDVVMQIVLKLPVKSILRFKSVNKSWYSLFSSPKFSRSYLHTASNMPCLMVQTHNLHKEETAEIRVVENPCCRNPIVRDLIPPIATTPNFELVGCINGLVCLSLRADASSFVLWNPAIGKHFRIPNANEKVTTGDSIYTGLAYDEETKCYKVVRVIRPWFNFVARGTEYLATMEIYNSGTNTWRLHKLDSFPSVSYQVACGSIFRGTPYWFETEFVDQGPKTFVMHFDPSDEKLRWKDVDVQCEVEELLKFNRTGMGFEGEKPVLFGLKPDEPDDMGSILKIWRMDKEFVAVEKTSVNVGLYLERVLGVWRNGDTIGLDVDGELVLYDYENDEPAYLPLPPCIHYLDNANACEYIPSLVPPSYPSA